MYMHIQPRAAEIPVKLNTAPYIMVRSITALHGMQTRSSDGNSVCPSVRPSVCLSVKRVDCDKTEESCI